MKKYEFTSEEKYVRGVHLKKIRALIDFGDVKAGELGGWIEKEENLSHKGNAWVYDDAWVYDNGKVYGDAWVYGNGKVCGNAWVYGDAEVFSASHVLVVGVIGSRNGFTTFFRDKDSEISVKCGCFYGKIDEFAKKVEKTHGNSKHGLVYKKAVDLAKLQIDLEG